MTKRVKRAGRGVMQGPAFEMYTKSKKYPNLSDRLAYFILASHKNYIPLFKKMLHDRREWREEWNYG